MQYHGDRYMFGEDQIVPPSEVKIEYPHIYAFSESDNLVFPKGQLWVTRNAPRQKSRQIPTINMIYPLLECHKLS